jgi:hypothetical protein
MSGLRIGVGKFRLTEDGGAEFESFHDIKEALDIWFNPIFERIHQGRTFTIMLKPNSQNQEYPYKLQYNGLRDESFFSFIGEDLYMNFDNLYDREPTWEEFLTMWDVVKTCDFEYEIQGINNTITDIIKELSENGELPKLED